MERLSTLNPTSVVSYVYNILSDVCSQLFCPLLQGFECPKNYNPADYFLGLISNGEEEEPQLSLRGTSRGISASSQSGSTVGSELQDAVGNIQEVEMVGGLFVTSTGRPITDLNKLVTSFKESKESDVLKKRIDVIQSGAFENPGQGKVQVQRSCPGKATRSWCKEVDALVWVRTLLVASPTLSVKPL